MLLPSLPSVAPQKDDTLIQLLTRVSRRDRQAFASLYQATHLKLFGVALRILKQRQCAEDVLQEIYIKIWTHAVDFDTSRGSPIAWMVTIARNRALDEVRRRPQLIVAGDISDMHDICDLAPLASETVESSEARQKLAGCLQAIDEQKRQMVLLAYLDGYSRDQLARRFGHPVATVKTWLRRSLDSLKHCLAA